MFQSIREILDLFLGLLLVFVLLLVLVFVLFLVIGLDLLLVFVLLLVIDLLLVFLVFLVFLIRRCDRKPILLPLYGGIHPRRGFLLSEVICFRLLGSDGVIKRGQEIKQGQIPVCCGAIRGWR